MVLEKAFMSSFIAKRPYASFFLAFLYSIIGFFAAWLFFVESLSIAMLFITTLLLIPTLRKLLTVQEKKERKAGLKNFLKNHKDVFEIYIFSFFGVLLGYIFLGLVFWLNNPGIFNLVFDFQTNYLVIEQGVTTELIKNFVATHGVAGFGEFMTLLSQNLFVVLLCFLLSFLYGASAIFLIMLNASIFANFLLIVINKLAENFNQMFLIFGIFLLHLVPEISGFLLAAISGGVISKALLLEDRRSKAFRNVIKDATILFAIACGLIMIGAAIETFISTRLFALLF